MRNILHVRNILHLRWVLCRWQAHANELPLLYLATWVRLRCQLELELGKQASGREKLEALRQAVRFGIPGFAVDKLEMDKAGKLKFESTVGKALQAL